MAPIDMPIAHNPQFRLLDLPDELLLEIFNHGYTTFDSIDLYRSAILCRRIREVALPLFLKKHGISNPEDTTIICFDDWRSPLPQPDALSGLIITPSLVGKSIKNLTCYFQSRHPYETSLDFTQQHPINLLHVLDRLTEFIRRLGSLETVRIYLLSRVSLSTQLRKESTMFSPEDALMNWTALFGGLLGLLLEKQTRSLTIQYEYDSWKRHVPSSLTIFSRVVDQSDSSDDETLSDDDAPSASTTTQKFPVELSANPCMLHSLFIHSSILMYPPFVNWTLDLLKTTPTIVNLSFAHLDLMETTWTTILDEITDIMESRLEGLCFRSSCFGLSIHKALNSVARFPNLAHLKLDRSFEYADLTHSTYGEYPTPKCRALQTLEVPAKIVDYLLQTRLAFSQTDTRRSRRLGEEPLQPHPLTSLVFYPSTSLITADGYTESCNFSNALFQRVRSRACSPETRFTLDLGDYSHTLDGITYYMEARKAAGTQDVRSPTFDNVKEVIFYRYRFIAIREEEESAASFCQWLKILFPDLEQVTFTYRSNTHPEEEVEEEVEKDDIKGLLEKLKVVCPYVKSVVVASQVHIMDNLE